MSEHLHLIREKEPDLPVGAGVVYKFYCEDCEAIVYIVHLHHDPVNP